MHLIVGLGNPGTRYANTWHNLGWHVLDALAQSGAFPPFTTEKKFKGEVSAGEVNGTPLLFLKPTTFMNVSGESVQAAVHWHKLDLSQLWVIHDDIDLPLGTLRVSRDASAGGHNGVASIIEHLGTQAFVRFRLGCATPDRERIPAEDFVLQRIDDAHQLQTNELIERCVAAVTIALTDGIDSAMNRFNTKPAP